MKSLLIKLRLYYFLANIFLIKKSYFIKSSVYMDKNNNITNDIALLSYKKYLPVFSSVEYNKEEVLYKFFNHIKQNYKHIPKDYIHYEIF